jgi:hypothetical protein
MRPLSGAFVVALVLAACTATPTGTASTAGQAATSPSSPATLAPSVPAPPTPSGTPGEFKSSLFQPPFTIKLPAGWTVAERGSDVAQIYRECATCTHGGEENGGNIEASAVDRIEVGTLSGAKFSATRTGPGEVSFPTTGYRSEAAGLPIDVYVLTLAGKTATVFIDPHESSGSAGKDFMDVARQILESFRTSP